MTTTQKINLMMKKWLACCLITLFISQPVKAQAGADVTASVAEDGSGSVSLTAKGIIPEPALFFNANATSTATITTDEIRQEINLKLNIFQGKPKTLTLGINTAKNTANIISVSGKGLASWAVRTSADGTKQFLDIKPTLIKGKPAPKSLTFTIKTTQKIISHPLTTQILTLTPASAAGFSYQINFNSNNFELKTKTAKGLIPLDEDNTFHSTGDSELIMEIRRTGASQSAVELRNVSINGVIDKKLGSATFTLTGTAKVNDPDGGEIEFLRGVAAVSKLDTDAAYKLQLSHNKLSGSGYKLSFDRAGTFPLNFQIVARIDEDSAGWQTINFTTPQGAVVPVSLSGLGTQVNFEPTQAFFPRLINEGQMWRGFLPATGHCLIAWKQGRVASEGKLAFTSKSLTEVSVGAGLMNQASKITFKVLQGNIKSLLLDIDGEGEILTVSGTNVAEWSVVEVAGDRKLKVRLSIPIKDTGELNIRNQITLGNFPIIASPMRLTPQQALRHSGHIRISNAGAVRLGTSGVKGVMQLSPEQFPGKEIQARQVFVFRYPSADYTLSLQADQILPEVLLNQVTIYEQTESDRIIRGSVELDIREAPLREWSLRIPEGYAVSSLNGSEVADYIVATTAENDMRDVKVIFKKTILGRQLINFQLEKNSPAKEGVWEIPAIEFPEAKSLRGHIGISAVAGWRVVAGETEELKESPLSYFPLKDPNIQQAYRLRASNEIKKWTANMKIEAREQSVQSDVFHLYSLKEGMTYGSVLLNYYVVGAPVNEWELHIPKDFGNLTIEGQNVRQWRREGDTDKVIVQLDQPVSDAATLLVTFENTMSARGGKLKLGEVHPMNVQSESGFIEIVSPVLIEHQVSHTTPGLLKISAQELPAEFRMLTTAPALAAWQYAARPFELEVDIAWYERGKTLEQVVDFANLTSRVSRDGQVMTEASFYVRSRGRQALRMTLPDNTQLWDAHADGQSVTARADGNQYLLPLPAGDDPNKPVKVDIRYGGINKTGSKVKLGAPSLTAPMIIASWQVSAEKSRLLIPIASGSKANTVIRQSTITQTGFESLQEKSLILFTIAALFIIAVFLTRKATLPIWGQALSTLCLIIITIIALSTVNDLTSERRVNLQTLEITSQVVNPDSPVSITLRNIPPWRAMVSWIGIIAAAVGVFIMAASLLMKKWRNLLFIAVAIIAAGILAQRGGGIAFLYIIATVALVLLFLGAKKIITQLKALKKEREKQLNKKQMELTEIEKLGSSKLTNLVLIGIMTISLFLGVGQTAQADEINTIDAISQTWRIEDERLFATMRIDLKAKAGTSHLLLSEPAVLTSFTGEGMQVRKIKHGKKSVWMLSAERSGALTATATYEMPIPSNQATFSLPTGPASAQKITARVMQAGLEIFSTSAMQTIRRDATTDEASSVEIALAPHPIITIELRAKGRDLDTEEVKFYAEIANLYLPSPGVVDGTHRVTIRPSSGKLGNIQLTVPNDFAVSDVTGGAIGNWRFDPESRQLSIDLEPAQSTLFSFQIETQQGLAALPANLDLASLSIAGDAGETNTIGIAFGQEAQPGKITTKDLSVMNGSDFDQGLIPSSPALTNPPKKPLHKAILHKAYRSVSGVGSISLQVAPVTPEIRVISQQELTLGGERILLSMNLNTNITRSGIFQLSFALPQGMEVESLSGVSLSHWTESVSKDKQRTITMHLNGRTIGIQNYSLVLTGSAIGKNDGWVTPRISINEALRQNGQLIIKPEKGIHIRAIDRQNISRINLQPEIRSQQINSFQGTAPSTQNGSLAFKILQSDWKLSLGIEKLDPWITTSVLHEVTLREGQTRTRISAQYQVEHASIKTIQLKLPSLTEEEARTVRASGTSVKEIVHIKNDVWELRFRRSVLGAVLVQIEYQCTADRGKGGSEKIAPATFLQSKRVDYFMAVRTTGRLDMKAEKASQGWRRSDWSATPEVLRNPADTSIPDLCYRLIEPEGSLNVTLKRHQMADTLKLRVIGGEMMTIFSPRGDTLTSVNLQTHVLEKSTLSISLPSGATLYNVMVNDQAVHVVRKGNTHLFHVSPGPVKDQPAAVSLVYSTPESKGDIKLAAPGFNVPLESLLWNVMIPEGYQLNGHSGGFQLSDSEGFQDYNINDYLNAITTQRTDEAQKGQAALVNANNYLQQGKREQAAKEFSKVTDNMAIDSASNEDARVQLRQLQTQQALWGLNSRRQRIYLDNKATGNEGSENRDLEDSAYSNPLFQGQKDFDVRKVDDFLRGNSLEEKKSLKSIANRIIAQQIATEPAPQTISTIVRGRGEVLRFTRGIQVNGAKELGLKLDIESTHRVSKAWSLMLLLGIAATGSYVMKK